MWEFKRAVLKTSTIEGIATGIALCYDVTDNVCGDCPPPAPPICCGDIFLPSSNNTDEDITYAYDDCETGETIFVTVYYNSSGETVYGRIPCNINSFDFTQARSTAIESCGDTVGGITLYSPNTTLELGDRLYEDGACAFAYAHGIVFMKEVSTGQVWQVDGNGLLIAAPTC